jgi:hypothetical protein
MQIIETVRFLKLKCKKKNCIAETCCVSAFATHTSGAEQGDEGTSGILYPWTGLGEMVRTGMYQYVPVQGSTGQYKNSKFVHTGMYQYILVCTFKKSSGFLTHPERVRRDEIRVIHRLCMGYNVTRSNFTTAQV